MAAQVGPLPVLHEPNKQNKKQLTSAASSVASSHAIGERKGL